MPGKNIHKLLQKTLKKEIVEYDTAYDTVEKNLPTSKDLAEFSMAFDNNGMENTFMFLFSRMTKIMKLLALKIDNK